jgi:hypothetical protein
MHLLPTSTGATAFGVLGLACAAGPMAAGP